MLENWDDATKVNFDHQVWDELCSLRFVDAGHNVMIMGPVGVGKTFMATAPRVTPPCAGATASSSARTDVLLKRLRACRLDNSHDAEMRKLIRVDLLILDDFALQPLDPLDTADIYELIVERHRAASTVVTSNREPIEWLGQMADALLAQSAIDRLQSAAYELVLDGESYRKHQKPGLDVGTTTPQAPTERRALTAYRQPVIIACRRCNTPRGGPFTLTEGWSHQLAGDTSRYSSSTGARLRHLRFTQPRGLLSTDSVGDSGVCVVSAQPIQHSDPSCQCQTRSLGFFDAQTTREDPQDEMWRPNQFKIRGFNPARSRPDSVFGGLDDGRGVLRTELYRDRRPIWGAVLEKHRDRTLEPVTAELICFVFFRHETNTPYSERVEYRLEVGSRIGQVVQRGSDGWRNLLTPNDAGFL